MGAAFSLSTRHDAPIPAGQPFGFGGLPMWVNRCFYDALPVICGFTSSQMCR
jgi:hypothetical protein